MGTPMQQPVQILPISEEHIESLHRALDSVARERLHLAMLEAPPLDAFRAVVLANLARGIPEVVALDGDQVVGWCMISLFNREVFEHRGNLGMGVVKAYRRRGIGQRLMTHALQKAKDMGLERIELEVFASNTPAIALYEKMGFVTEGIKTRARKLDGEYDDVVQMALFL